MKGLKSKAVEDVRSDIPDVPMPGGEVVRVNLNVPKSIRNKWKAAALAQDMTVTDLIMQEMLKYSK